MKSVTQQVMRSQLVVAALRALRAARGAQAVEELRRRFALSPDVEQQKDVTLTLDDHRRLMDVAAELAGDALFGVHIARAEGRNLYGLISFATRTSPSVREGLSRVAKFIRLSNDTVDMRFDEHPDGTAALRQRVDGDPLCLGRHDNEFFVALIVEETRRLTEGSAQPTRVWFAHPRPRGIDLGKELRVSDVSFDAGENGVLYGAGALDAALVTADTAMLAYIEDQSNAALAALAAERGLIAQARIAIERALAEEAPTLETTAKALGMSARSLQRRLADEGSSFQELLDHVRQALARSHVDDGRPLGEIAHALGYRELRPFLRAFKRWTGMTPTQFRTRPRGS
jgi:AraC-like DNA-binding protein